MKLTPLFIPLLAATTLYQLHADEAPARKLNILHIHADDHRPDGPSRAGKSIAPDS